MIDRAKAWTRTVRLVLSLMPAFPAASPVVAADLGTLGAPVDAPSSMPRFFPRGDGSESEALATRPRRGVLGCRPRRAPVPTNAPDDPSFVGSEYGLSRPSYYGFTPPRGVDDPYGRPVLAYCR